MGFKKKMRKLRKKKNKLQEQAERKCGKNMPHKGNHQPKYEGEGKPAHPHYRNQNWD